MLIARTTVCILLTLVVAQAGDVTVPVPVVGTTTVTGDTVTLAGAVDTTGNLTIRHRVKAVFNPGMAVRYGGQLHIQAGSIVEPAIAWDTPEPIIWGTTLGPIQLNATTNVPGTWAYNPPGGAVLDVGTHPLSVTFTPEDLTTYAVTTASVELVVQRVPTTITWATPSAIDAGTALSATQLSATGSVDGTLVYDPPAGTVLAPGTHTLAVTFTPTDAQHYATVQATVELVVRWVFHTTQSPLPQRPPEPFDAAVWTTSLAYRTAYVAAHVPERVWESLPPQAVGPHLRLTGAGHRLVTVGSSVTVLIQTSAHAPVSCMAYAENPTTDAFAQTVAADEQGNAALSLLIDKPGRRTVLVASPLAKGQVRIDIEGVVP